ncbi:hypothetical protein SAMN04488057_102159 [Cyclobacterium lianum]|uniref:Uncharacterized protein n=1 Tax=Cyclobacterium lianum TaxID=388280 RepID=A0A1M7JTS4_9BACT|nr:DUF6702 family protein [Cyclobacterium lianum]SHM56459.1 hypothetical protein SAMN04488057_102159 [Cyclobacterium lianum]
MLAIKVLLLQLPFWLGLHPFYISLTDMVFNESSQTVEIAQKIFWDDLEVALSNRSGQKVNFLEPAQKAVLESQIEDYILAHNSLLIHGDTIALSYLGHEIEAEAAWFYMESEQISNPEEITIYNNILIDDFPLQQNIVNFYKNRKPKSLITRKDKTSGTLILD